VGVGADRYTWETVYSVDLPSSKISFAASILWRLASTSGDDWKAVSAAVNFGPTRILDFFIIFSFFRSCL
jgi:hypothetical protein